MLIELRQPLNFETPKGKAQACFVIDYGPDSNLLWVCFVKKTGECWTFDNASIRLERNETTGMAVLKTEQNNNHRVASSVWACEGMLFKREGPE